MTDGVNVDFGLLKQPDYTGEYANAFQMGRQLAQQQGQAAAGQLYATNPTAGASAMMQYNPELGMQMTQGANQQADRAANISAATSFANGDLNGANAALAKTGNIQGIAEMNSEARQMALQRAQMVAGVLHSLTTIQDPQARLDVARHIAATSGIIDPQSINLDDVTDAGIAGHMGAAMSLEQQLAEADKQSTLAETHRHNVATEGKPQYVETRNADGSTTQTLVNGPAVAAAGGGQGATLAATPSGGVPRGLRNNNPLNVSVLPQGQWSGQTGADGQYATFATPQDGWAAADRNLQTYATAHGLNTIAQVVQRWAPAGAGNNPAQYAQTVAQSLGVQPDQPLNLQDAGTRQKVLEAMARVENGQPVAYGQGVTTGTAATPLTLGGSSGAGVAPGDTTKSGDAYLQSLDPSTRAQVQAILDGRMVIPSGAALRSPMMARLMAAAAQADPSFDQANAGARAKTRADFTSGQSARNIVALNTALGHLNVLDQSIDKLNNGSFQPFNAIGNAFSQTIGEPTVPQFDAAKTAVADELTRVFRGNGGAEGDVKGWLAQLDAAKSPQQLHAVVKQMAELLASRVNALGDQYAQGMGVTRDGMTLLHPEAAATLARLGGQNAAEAEAKAQFYQRAEAAGMPARNIDGAWQQYAKGKTFGGQPASGSPESDAALLAKYGVR